MEEYIKNYLEHFTSAKDNKWNYEDGCVLIGLISIYEARPESYIKDFILNYLDYYITEEGNIRYYNKMVFHLDSISPGRALFFAYRETGEEKYKKAMDLLYSQLMEQPRTQSGSFWHKDIYPNQIWLDGLFMAMPFYIKYNTEFGNMECYADIVNQFVNARNYLFHEGKRLYYHGYDETGKMPWAAEKNHCSKNFWLRSMGWLLIALVDTMEEMSETIFEHYKTLEGLFKEALFGILKYQEEESKLFYQIIDRPDVENNYLETSGSIMIAAAILKGCRMRVLLSEKYAAIGEGILSAVIDQKLVTENGIKKLTDICYAAGLGPGEERDGSVEYYLSEPIVCDDQKGAGALMMAYGQWLKLNIKDGIINAEIRKA